jgi:hypothetical protein
LYSTSFEYQIRQRLFILGKSKGSRGRQQPGAKQQLFGAHEGFSEREIQTGITRALLGMPHIPSSSKYEAEQAEAEHIAKISHGRLSERRETAVFIPGVNFILGATLATLNLSKVKARLAETTEMVERAHVAQVCTKQVVQTLIRDDSNPLIDQYIFDRESLGLPDDPDNRERSEQLERFIARHCLVLDSKSKMFDLGGVSFSDVTPVAGGGVKTLRNHGVTKNLSAIIGRSTSLQLIASLQESVKADKAQAYLGMPYADPEHYVYIPEEGERQAKLTYTDETAAHLRSLYIPGAGCPARGVSLPGSPHKTLLRSRWADVVDFLTPDYVTVNSSQLAQPAPMLASGEQRYIGVVIPPA